MLEQALNLSGNNLRKQVNRLRREGVPIASCKRGYFYAETAREVYATIRELKKMPVFDRSTALDTAFQYGSSPVRKRS